MTGRTEELAVRRAVVTAVTQGLLVMELCSAQLAGPVVITDVARAFAGTTCSSAYRGLDRVGKRQGAVSFPAGLATKPVAN
jgi:hypothetical protein